MATTDLRQMRFIRQDIQTATTPLKDTARDYNLLVRFLLILLISITTFASAHASFVVDSLVYYRNSDTCLTVAVTSKANIQYRNVVIPANVTHNDTTYTVTQIRYDAFKNCTGLKSVSIPNSVTTIGSHCFEQCKGLISVTLPSSLTSIDCYAFGGCSGLKSIVIPQSVKYIGFVAFAGSGLTSVEIPNSVTEIDFDAFSSCSNLRSVIIPNSVSKIGFGAFRDIHNVVISAFPLPLSRLQEYKINNKDAYYNLDLIGAPKTTFTAAPRQESCVITLGKSYFQHAPAGYQDISIVAQGVLEPRWPNPDSLYLCDNDHKVYMNNLYPGGTYKFHLYTKYSDGTELNEYRKEYTFTTHGLNLSCKSDVTPTTISAVFSYKMDDAKFDSQGIRYNNKNYADNKITLTGLKPNTEYTIKYYVWTESQNSDAKDFKFKTPEIKFTMLQPKGVTNSNTIVAATTNLSDLVTTAGFQWKKYDAPASLEPNEAFAAIYDGRLEGYLKNLQSTSYYNVRAFYKDPTTGTYVYSDWKTFDPSDFSYFEPTVHTYPVMECGSDTAIVRGYVLPGSDAIIKQGIEYWGNDSQNAPIKVFAPDYSSEDVQTIFASGQVMTVKLENLVPETDYKFRAFAITQAGTTYGEEQSFTTKHSGITVVENSTPRIIGYYDLQGIRHEHPQQGFNIILYDNGTTKKVLFK